LIKENTISEFSTNWSFEVMCHVQWYWCCCRECLGECKHICISTQTL